MKPSFDSIPKFNLIKQLSILWFKENNIYSNLFNLFKYILFFKLKLQANDTQKHEIFET